mgnify:CR=1 FL=1
MFLTMKILLISNYKKNIGGISVQVDLLKKIIENEKYETEIFSLKAKLIKRVFLFFMLFFVGRKYNVFHIHCCSGWGFLPAVYGVIAGKLLRKHIIITYHGGGADNFFKAHPWLTKFILTKANHVVVLSNFHQEIFSKYNINCVVIPNIIMFDQEHYREKNQIEPNFISVRHLSPLYNIPCIIKAFYEVQQKFPLATLTILGDGPSKPELESLVRSMNISNVIFTGQVANSKIYDYLTKADIFLSAPSTDNLPVSILEAFNAGLLVISSNVGGIPYLVENGRTGYLFEYNHNDDLTEKMAMAVKEQQKSLEIIANAHHEIKKFHPGIVKSKLLYLYQN